METWIYGLIRGLCITLVVAVVFYYIVYSKLLVHPKVYEKMGNVYVDYNLTVNKIPYLINYYVNLSSETCMVSLFNGSTEVDYTPSKLLGTFPWPKAPYGDLINRTAPYSVCK